MGARGRQAQQRVGAAATKSRSQLLLGTNTPLGVSIATAAAAAAVAAGFEIAVLQPLFVMWRWQLQRFPVALEDASRHVRVALRPDIATAVVFPAKARRDDQLVQEKHMCLRRDVEHRSHPYRFHVLEVPTAHLGDHYRHRLDLGRCCEAWVPSTCSGNVPHGLRDPCSHHRSLLHLDEHSGFR